MAGITLTAASIESFEKCRRAWLWGETWELGRVTPIGTLYRALHAVLTAPEHNPRIAYDYVITEAGDRGVWTLRNDPYPQMVHTAHLAEILAKIIRQPTAEPVQTCPVVDNWQPSSYVVDEGTRLMRFVLVDHWDDDRQLAELHSWRTVGDICVTNMPMTLRVIVIGQMRDGRRHSFWSKGQRHPVNKTLRFARKHGKADGLSSSWDTIWREDSGISAQTWLQQMAQDGVIRELAFTVPKTGNILVPGKIQRDRVLDDIKRNAEEMALLLHKNANLLPMTRSACDDPIRGQCPFACICYAPTDLMPAETGVFRKRPALTKILTK